MKSLGDLFKSFFFCFLFDSNKYNSSSGTNPSLSTEVVELLKEFLALFLSVIHIHSDASCDNSLWNNIPVLSRLLKYDQIWQKYDKYIKSIQLQETTDQKQLTGTSS